MKIIDNQIVLSEKHEIINELEADIKALYGENFKIKEGGILYQLFDMFMKEEMNLQENLKYFISQYNPETAENIYQDALCNRIGVSRLDESFTTFSKEVQGAPNCTVDKNTVLIRSNQTEYEFINSSEFTTNEKGLAIVDFVALTEDEISVFEDETFTIIKAPPAIEKLTETLINSVAVGRTRENDEQLRIRFRNSKAFNSYATDRADKSNLGKYISNMAFLNIIDKNSDPAMDPKTVKIIAKHETTDILFANAIVDTFGCGIKFEGTTTVPIKTSDGEIIEVKFTNAGEIPIEIHAKIKIENGYYDTFVISEAKKKILSYVTERVFGLGNIIYPSEFIIPLLKNNFGIEGVNEIKIKRTSDSKYTEYIQLKETEVPIFDADNIFLEKEV